jgi:hypothetical protein
LPLSHYKESDEVSDNVENSDLVWGASEIGKVIGRSPRATFHLLEKQLLPARKVGRAWVGSRKRLLRAVLGDEPAGPAA